MAGISAVTAATVGASLVGGLVLALWAALKRAVTEHPPEGLASAIGAPRSTAHAVAVVNVALIPLALLCGVLTDRLPAPVVLMAGCVALTVALLWLSVRPTWPRDLTAVLLAALGGSAVNLAALVLMPQAFFGPHQAMGSVAVGSVLVALSALAGSALVDVLITALGHKRTLALLAFLCLVPAFPATAALAALNTPSTEPPASADNAAVWLAALVLFLYAPLEAMVALWTTTTLASAEDAKDRGRRLVAGFWTVFVVSRLAVALAQYEDWLSLTWQTWLPVLAALLVAVVLGNLSGAGASTRRWPGVVLLGAFLGPVFPALVGDLLRRLTGTGEAGTACGLLAAAGSLGCLLAAPLFRPAADRPSAGLRRPMLLALGLTAVALVFALTAS
jgi:hypothetical protein